MKHLFSNLKGDAFGGLTSGIVALPLALAFGVSSGLGPTAGIFGAVFISFFASLFGGTNTQISGPTAPMTAVSMVVIAGIVAANKGDLSKALPAILTVFLLAGLMQVAFGLVGLGKYIRFIPYPVVSGFMTAIGLIILITQILPSVGYYPKEDKQFVEQFAPQAKALILETLLEEETGDGLFVVDNLKQAAQRFPNITEQAIYTESKTLASKSSSGTLGTLKILPRALKNMNWLELILALGTICIIYGFKKLTKAVPSTLVALVFMSAIAYGLNLNYIPIEKIPGGIPIPKWEIFTAFNFKAISPYILTALTLALLGAIDSLLTSVVADNMTKTKHSPNKELIGQGIGNSIAAIFGGIPGAGATIRTVVNIKSGGKTRRSGMIAGIVLLIIFLGLSSIASKIPAAVLAGILITVGIGVIDYKGLKAISSLPKDLGFGPLKLNSEVIIMITVLLLSTFWNLVYAVGIGLVMASLLFMKKIGDLTGSQSNVKALKEEAWTDEINFPTDLKEKVFIKHIEGPLFFGSTSSFQQIINQIPVTATQIIIRMDKMRYIDQSGLYALEDVMIDLKKSDKHVLLVGVLKQPRYMMERIDIIPDLIPNNHIFNNFQDCLHWLNTTAINTTKAS